MGAELVVRYGIEEAKERTRHDRGLTLEDHLAALEKNFALLDEEVAEYRDDLDKEIDGVRISLRNMARLQREVDDKEKAFLQELMPLRWLGIPLFLLGAVFSMIANTISCS